jgi:branched-chain amino acid transport system ATP-binding protein
MDLTLSGLTLRFAGLTALDDVSLTVPSGTLQAVIGPNGAGKTSLFNCISGVYVPQEGDLRFGDEDLRTHRPHAMAGLGVARMFQNLAVFPHLTVLENLLLGRHHLWTSSWIADLLSLPSARREEVRNRRVVEEIIEFLDLEAVRKTPAGILPYGVLKRVELGRALAMEPKLLLLDEPAAGLNQEETEDLARYLLDVHEERGTTMILIEHDLGFVLDLADRVAVLDFGRLVTEGTPAEIAADPRVQAAYVGVA